MLKAVSLFTGCGGSDKGLVDAGYQIVMANDVNAYAKEVYKANLPVTDYILSDIAEIKLLPSADLLIGCYPCQGYSQGGARDAKREVNTLYRQFDRSLRQISPKVFIVENVAGMVRSNNLHFLNNQLVRFRLAGYKVTWQVVNTVQYGLAQERKRIFIVGIRTDLKVRYVFPKATHGPGLVPFRSQADVLRNLKVQWPIGEYCDDEFHWYYLSRNRYRSWNQPSRTILAKARHMPLHPMSPRLVRVNTDKWVFDGDSTQARRLSFREAACLQNLEGWNFPDSMGLLDKYKVIGNAVPPLVFRKIVESIPEEALWH